MRWDSSFGQYDMGFRNYAPGLNQFLSRDMYGGALADMSLTTDAFTGNRYTFGGGDPISNIELDGHTHCDAGYCPTLQQTEQVTKAAAAYGAGCPATMPGCPGSTTQITGALVGSPPLLSPPGAPVDAPPAEAPPVEAPPAEAPPEDLPGGGLIVGILGALTLLSGDSAQPHQQQLLKLNTTDRSRGCFSQTGTGSEIIYYNRDYSQGEGRATGVEACLSPTIRGIDESEMPTPPGWQKGMDRGHLLARWFGGESRLENAVPLWPNANRVVMRAIENQIRTLLDLGQRVYYMAAPVYSSADPYVPLGINIWYGSSITPLRNRFVDNVPPP